MNLIPHLIHVYGLVVVAVIVGIECVGFPLPGETALLAAAIDAATKHDLNIDAVILTATGAAVVGRTVGYLIGRKFGYRLLLHYKNHLGLTEGRIKLGQYLFLKHGGKIIFVAQFAPVLRAFAGLLAGANVMPWRKFMLANVASSGVWAMIYGYAAYWIGHVQTDAKPSRDLSRDHNPSRIGRLRHFCTSVRGAIGRQSRTCNAGAA